MICRRARARGGGWIPRSLERSLGVVVHKEVSACDDGVAQKVDDDPAREDPASEDPAPKTQPTTKQLVRNQPTRTPTMAAADEPTSEDDDALHDDADHMEGAEDAASDDGDVFI